MRRLLALASLLLAVPFASSCGDSGVSGTTVTRSTSDDIVLHATYRRQSSAVQLPTVLLIHEDGPGHDRDDFEPAWSLLENQGFNLLAIDLRSHGDSDVAGSPDDLRTDPNGYTIDLLTWLDFLQERSDQADPIDRERIGVIGLGVGGSLAVAGIQKNQIDCGIAISPAVDEVEALRGGIAYRGADGDDDDSAAGDDDDSAAGDDDDDDGLDPITNVAFIDGSGAGTADDTQALYDQAQDERSILFVDGPQSGALILEDFDEALAVVGAWCWDLLQ